MTSKSITIAKASKQLGVLEEQLRQSVKPLYPETWETIKSIKLGEFEMLIEALRDLAKSEETEEPETTIPVDKREVSILADEPKPSELIQASEPTTPVEDTNIILTESSDLAPQQAEALKVATIQSFSDFALDLNQITQALAYSTALKNFANFKEIHSTTFRHHAEQYVQDFGQEYQQMLSDLEEKCDPKAFLSVQGITTELTKT